MVEMFCIKCKRKVSVPENDAQRTTTPKGRKVLKASCPNCGTNMIQFVK